MKKLEVPKELADYPKFINAIAEKVDKVGLFHYPDDFDQEDVATLSTVATEIDFMLKFNKDIQFKDQWQEFFDNFSKKLTEKWGGEFSRTFAQATNNFTEQFTTYFEPVVKMKEEFGIDMNDTAKTVVKLFGSELPQTKEEILEKINTAKSAALTEQKYELAAELRQLSERFKKRVQEK